MFTNIYKLLKAFMLVGSIANNGVGAPILASKEGIVLDGNSRLHIAKKLGLKSIPVVFIDAEVEQIDPNDLIEGY